MTKKGNITNLSLEGLAEEHSDDLAEQAIRWLAQISRMRITVLLHELFEQIDDALFVAAEREQSGNNESSYATGLREVRRQRQTVTDCFFTRMAQSFESLEKQGPVPESADTSTKATANPEVAHAFAEMQSKAEEFCFRALNELNQHLGELRDQSPIQLDDNPLAPGNLCRYFDYAIGLITAETKIKLTICGNFDRYVVSQMRFVLDFVNGELRKLAKLKESSKPKRQHHLFATIKTLLASKRIASQQEEYQKQLDTRAPVPAETGVAATQRDTTDQALDRWFVEESPGQPKPTPLRKPKPAAPVEPPVLDPPPARKTVDVEPLVSIPVSEPVLQIVEPNDKLLDADGEPLPELIIEPPRQPPGSFESVLDDEWLPEIDAEIDQEGVSVDAKTLTHDQSDSESPEAENKEPIPDDTASPAEQSPAAKPKPLRLPPLPPLAEGEQRVIFTGDILAVLKRMQGEATAGNSGDATPISEKIGESGVKQELLSRLADCREEYHSAEFSEEDEGTIDLVDLVFDFVLHDHNLPGPLQAILAQLQFPYLRVALLDWQLFALAGHPARKLLDELARAALGWSAETDHDLEIYRRIEIVTQRIMSDHSGTQDTFVQLLDSFGRYIHRFERRAKESEKLALEELQQRERLKALKKSTVTIGQLMAGTELPDLVDEILRRTMPEIMVSQWLRYGADSVQWQESQALVEDLIESVTLPANAAGLAELETLLPIMSVRLHDCLDALEYDQRQKDQLVGQLGQMYRNLLGADFSGLLTSTKDPGDPQVLSDARTGAKTETAVDDTSATETDDDNIDFYEAAQLILGASREEADQAVSADSLHEALAGSWFEFKDETGQPVRAKLSWAKPVGSKYLFVDQNGETIADKTLTELAAEVKAGKAMILESIPLFERALGAIADRLQQEDSGTGH